MMTYTGQYEFSVSIWLYRTYGINQVDYANQIQGRIVKYPINFLGAYKTRRANRDQKTYKMYDIRPYWHTLG